MRVWSRSTVDYAINCKDLIITKVVIIFLFDVTIRTYRTLTLNCAYSHYIIIIIII